MKRNIVNSLMSSLAKQIQTRKKKDPETLKALINGFIELKKIYEDQVNGDFKGQLAALQSEVNRILTHLNLVQ